MGRDITCDVRWGDESSSGKVLLESKELIIRGSLRRRVPLSAMEGVAVQGDTLAFQVEGTPVCLHLGAAAAERWARALARPTATLASKLGISSATHLLLIGDASAPELQAAIANAASVNGESCNLALVFVDTQAELEAAVARVDSLPVWVVYPKGRGKAFSESVVRSSVQSRGYVDTKVASVSSGLTGLRFNKRRS